MHTYIFYYCYIRKWNAASIARDREFETPRSENLVSDTFPVKALSLSLYLYFSLKRVIHSFTGIMIW